MNFIDWGLLGVPGIQVSRERGCRVYISLEKGTINKTSGEKVFEQSLGKYAQGQQDITLPLNLASGVYLLRLTTGKKAQQTIVIKK